MVFVRLAETGHEEVFERPTDWRQRGEKVDMGVCMVNDGSHDGTLFVSIALSLQSRLGAVML